MLVIHIGCKPTPGRPRRSTVACVSAHRASALCVRWTVRTGISGATRGDGHSIRIHRDRPPGRQSSQAGPSAPAQPHDKHSACRAHAEASGWGGRACREPVSPKTLGPIVLDAPSDLAPHGEAKKRGNPAGCRDRDRGGGTAALTAIAITAFLANARGSLPAAAHIHRRASRPEAVRCHGTHIPRR